MFGGGSELPLDCHRCGRPLGDDPEDEPDGIDGLPLCGECSRNRDEAADFEMSVFTGGDMEGYFEV